MKIKTFGKGISSILFFLCFFLLPIFTTAQTTVAIGDFQNRTNRLYLDSWEQKIPEFLHSELSRSREIVLVERLSLQTILDEQALTMTGLIDSSTAQVVGKLLRAQYVITGSINMSGDLLRIDSKVINVSTGKIVGEKVQGRIEKHLDKMVELLGNNLRYQLTGKGGYRAKVLLKQYPAQYFLIGTLGSAVITYLVHNAYLNKRDDYRKATRLESFNPFYDSANRLYQTRIILTTLTGLGLTGTLYCWIRNLSPDEILAASPPILPYMMSSKKGDFTVGLRFLF